LWTNSKVQQSVPASGYLKYHGGVALSPDGTVFAMAGRRPPEVNVWAVESGEGVRTFDLSTEGAGNTRYDLSLMSAATPGEILDEGCELVIVARVGGQADRFHFRVFGTLGGTMLISSTCYLDHRFL
jgi:hypothetical protein